MKKLTLFAALLVFVQMAFAGGILTNTNQSAQFIRMLSRNASTDIDAVYFNPAGLIKLQDGWHFAFYSQSIFQDKTVDSKFPLLNDGHYAGKVSVPVFPTAFAVYKKENWAFSLGFGPNGGGGSADFDRGLPSFEIPITKVVPALAGLTQINPALAVTGYDADLNFSGSSVFWGIQLGATYKVNDIFSVYGGVRYLPSKNTYEGSIKNIQLKVGSQYYAAPGWLTQTSGAVKSLSDQAIAAGTLYSGAASSVQQLITAGAGSYTIAQVQNAGYITSAQRSTFEGALANLGMSSAQIAALNMSQVQGAFSNASTQYSATGAVLATTATTLSGTAGLLADKEVKTEQTGAGFTPMIGVHISPSDVIDIAVKYELKTALQLTNSTTVDDLGLFPDGGKSNSDLPAILGIGVGLKPAKWLDAQLSYTGYFNKGVDWGYNTRDLAIWKDVDPTKIRKRGIDKNGYELGLGLQFNITEKFSLSTGGLYGDMGVADSYQSDFSYSNPSFTIGGGLMWKITDKLTMDAGFSDTFYKDQVVPFTDPDLGNYTETLGKTTINFAVGISYSIF